MPPKGSPGKKQKNKKRGPTKKVKKALVMFPTRDTDEESQSLLLTQPKGHWNKDA